MSNGLRFGESYMRAIKERLASESVAYKWHRKAQARLSYTTTVSIRPTRLSKEFILKRYLDE